MAARSARRVFSAPGDIPIRKNGDGTLPDPGWTDEYQWQGYIPFDELPRTFNPEAGFIVTANNAVISPEYPYLIATDFDRGYRARRITDLITNAPALITVDYIKQMHRSINENRKDAYSIPDNRDLVAQLFLLYSASGDPTDFEEERDYDYRRANIRVSINTSTYTNNRIVIEALEPYLVTQFNTNDMTAHLSGHDTDVLETSRALIGYSIGLIGIIAVKVLAPGFYARQDIRTPVKIGVATLLVTQMMNLLFIFGLDLKHAGLALSSGLGACFNSAVLFYFLRKRGIYQPEPGWGKFFFKLCVAVLALGLTLWFGMGNQQHWFAIQGWERIIHLAWLVVAGVLSYFAALFVLGFRMRDFAKRGAN